MGLDKQLERWFTKFMNDKLSLEKLGSPAEGGVKGFLSSFFGRRRKRVSPQVQERRRFEQEAKGQFLKLKEKGLGISVFTL